MLGSPEKEPEVFASAFMQLRSLGRNDSFPGSVACPTSNRPRGANAPRPASAPLRRASFISFNFAATGPAFCRAAARSYCACLAFSIAATSFTLLVGTTALPSTHCDKNAPCIAATAPPHRTPQGSPPPPQKHIIKGRPFSIRLVFGF